MDQATKRTLLLSGLFIGGLAIVTVIVYNVILGGSHGTGSPQATVGTQISQAIANPLTPDTVPVEGKDFTVEDQAFFENDTWMVATIVPKPKDATDPATIVMKLENGAYVPSLGPGTAFQAETATHLPASVFNHLRDKGLMIEQSEPGTGADQHEGEGESDHAH